MVTNPLWNSGGCGHRSRGDCCKHHDPWFTTNVGKGKKIEDDIEVRMCHNPPNKLKTSEWMNLRYTSTESKTITLSRGAAN